jgi:PAS domain S-box-containing protein/putative nucleotidyltransferase with HDIG domain
MKGNERGPLAHYIAIARDVTLREAASAAMRASEERLALALDATSDGLYDIDFETSTTHYSPRYATMLGYEPNELTPSHETWERLLHPEDRTRALESLNECLDGKMDEYEMEFRLRTKSGAWRWILSRGKVVARDASGRALRLVGTHRDITARVESVAALAESERRYREMANALPTCVFEADLNGRLTYANQTGLDWFGYSEDEIVRQRNVAEMVIEEQRERAARTFRRVAEAGEVPASAYTALRSDGTTFPALVSSRAIVRDGKAIGVRGVLVDITERVEAARRIERALSGTIHALAVTTEMRDPYTAGHQERVTRLAMAMAARMGLPADRVEGLRVAGLLHDVGKVSVPAEILSKPTGLSAIELALVRSHSEAGYAILREIAFPWPVATIVLQHHERMDGSGYPSGLRGEEILLEARILAVADSVEAMASHRPYRAALGIEEALAELARGRGTAYDVDAVSACLSLFTEDGFRWDV